jgi:hypothetical protein
MLADIHEGRVGAIVAWDLEIGSRGRRRREDALVRRRAILTEALQVELVAASDAARAYIADWGPPNTRRRLEKMITAIAAFARTAKRRSTDMSAAIFDWESDLEWLRSNYG